MITLLVAAVAWATLCTPNGPWADLVHPSQEPAPADTIVVVRELDMDVDPEIRDASGAPVPATVVTHAGTHRLYKVLSPVEPLAPGTYTVTTDHDFTDTFEVVDGAAPTVDPPIPVVRELLSELEEQDDCGYGDTSFTLLRVRLCGAAPLYVVAEGPSEPPPPDLAVPGDFWLSASARPSVAEPLGVHAGWTGTLWYGSFDAAGRFSGWTGPDPVEMPPAICGTVERMPGAEGSAGYTPATFDSCPDFTAWELDEELYCPNVTGDWECGPASDDPAGTCTDAAGDAGSDDPPETEPAEGRGCATVETPALPAGALLLAILGLRRRGPRRSHTFESSR